MVAGGRSPGRPRAETDPDTRAQTLLAAQIQFGERGFSGVSMDQLAKAAGVNVRAIYHYFPSKRALFDAAANATFETYGALVLEHVFVHDSLRARLHGFVEMYRVLYREKRHLLAMLSVITTDGIAEARRSPGEAVELPDAVMPIFALNEALIEAARARGELDQDVDDDAANALLQAIGTGLGFATLVEGGPFLAMLDALDLLIDGTLIRDEPDV